MVIKLLYVMITIHLFMLMMGNHIIIITIIIIIIHLFMLMIMT